MMQKNRMQAESWLDLQWNAEFRRGDEEPTDTTEKPTYRAVFISDLHLGTAGCQAELLLAFLKHATSEHLYLVGDIVDGWQLRKRWYWPQSHNDVVQKLLRKARKGCRVVFVPGNHDEFARQFIGHHFGGIVVHEEAVHITANGQRLWVIHGDAFDGVISPRSFGGGALMTIATVSDAWSPQVNGVVTTLVALQQQLAQNGRTVKIIQPNGFETWQCPGFPEVRLAKRAYAGVALQLKQMQPTRIHIATEGPLGWAARRYCIEQGLRFTTAFHTKFPETLRAACGIPVGLGYRLIKRFHLPSSGVLVPSRSVIQNLALRKFENLRAWTHGVDLAQFPFARSPQDHPALVGRKRPYALFAGRVSYEKSIEDFLRLPFEGTKAVAGDGPVKLALAEKYPQVVWLGRLATHDLASAYRAADVLVFPSKTDTFGLVMLEAMASGTPVAAHPVDGPLEVFDGMGAQGGVMNQDLGMALRQALMISRLKARHHAMRFTWEACAEQFSQYLVPAQT